MRGFAVMLAAVGASIAAPAAAHAETLLPVTLAVSPLSWEGEATVYARGRELKIAVRTRIDHLGNVVSESWPVELGEAKGLRRMTLTAGSGTIERGGQKEAMPEEVYLEERQQFEIYRILQVADDRARELAPLGVNTFSEPFSPRTWFRIDRDGTIIGAINEVNAVGGTAYQEFRFEGFWKSGEATFPKHMEMLRDGRPFFTLDVTKFDAL